MDNFAVRGLCAAPFTPFTQNGAVNHSAIPHHAAELLAQGVEYAFVCGTTGEGVTMSVQERQAVLESWISAAAGTALKVIAHVGAESIADVQALSKHAEQVGAVAVAAHSPTFNKPPDVDSLAEFLHIISVAAPTTPLYYYHISVKTGVNIACDKLLAAIHGSGRAPTFRGIKFTDFDLYVYANCIAFAGGKYDVLSGAYMLNCVELNANLGAICMVQKTTVTFNTVANNSHPAGRDEVLLGALPMGCAGAVGSTYNYLGRVANKLIAAYRAGDMPGALKEQRRIQAVVDLLNNGAAYGPAGVNVGKAIMELRLETRGSDLCGPMRYPGRRVSEKGYAALRADLEKLGFFQW